MATVTTPAVGRRLTPDRIILITLLVGAVLAAMTGARITWDVPTITGTSDETVAASPDAVAHAARVAAAGQELEATRQVARSVPAAAPALAERIETLRLVAVGALPVEASEPMPVAAVVAAGKAERAAAVVEARRQLTGLRQAVRASSSIGAALAEEMATLEAIGRGFVPPETLRPIE